MVWVAGGHGDPSSNAELPYKGRHRNVLRVFVRDHGVGDYNTKIWTGILRDRDPIEIRLKANSKLVVFYRNRYWTSLASARGAFYKEGDTYGEIRDRAGNTLRDLLGLKRNAY